MVIESLPSNSQYLFTKKCILNLQVLQPIQEIKPIQEQIVNLVECEMKALLGNRKQADPELTQNFDKILNAQQDCLSLLTAMKRLKLFKVLPFHLLEGIFSIKVT